MTTSRQTMPTPLANDVTKRKLDPATRYPWVLRFSDWRRGVVDGRVEADAEPAKSGTTPWLHGLQSGCGEAMSHELHSLEADTAEWTSRLGSDLAEIRRLQAFLNEAVANRSALAETPSEEELSRRGVAERRDADVVVRARRLREHRARILAPADREVAQLRTEIEHLSREAALLGAQIEVTRDVYAVRATRILGAHQRRAATYRRGFVRSAVRRQAESDVVRAFTGPDTLLRLPGWAEARNGRGWDAGIGDLDARPSTI